MPKEAYPSADRVLFDLEDKSYFEGLKCVGPYHQYLGVFKHPIRFYQDRSPCAESHQALEALLNGDSIPDEVKPPLRQIMESSMQGGVCAFWRAHGDPRAKSTPCKEAEAMLSQARNEFRRNYHY